ncbi:OmpA family protein [Candidatus Ruminimicrobium bovinum]|uniref:OmpA family protein n=1 Tax=Candidatus Ruminimicrobium bovinum TaxID=3242779 RepID=UPI0039B8FE53
MKKLLALLFCAVFVSACTTPGTKTAIGAGAGAALGAAAGAVITHNTGGKAGEGAIYGALAGAAAGGLIGNYYDKQAKELAAIADVKKTENGIEVTLKNDILFTTGSAELSEGAKKTLTDLNKVLKKYPENIIQVQGHTDSTGSASFNQTLSEKRAKAVYEFIVANGLKTSGLTYIGFGPNQPVASNDTAEGRAKNRRVELKITANKKLVEQNRQ